MNALLSLVLGLSAAVLLVVASYVLTGRMPPVMSERAVEVFPDHPDPVRAWGLLLVAIGVVLALASLALWRARW